MKSIIDDKSTDKVSENLIKSSGCDAFGSVMIYGNFKIRDVETDKIIINKRF